MTCNADGYAPEHWRPLAPANTKLPSTNWELEPDTLVRTGPSGVTAPVALTAYRDAPTAMIAPEESGVRASNTAELTPRLLNMGWTVAVKAGTALMRMMRDTKAKWGE